MAFIRCKLYLLLGRLFHASKWPLVHDDHSLHVFTFYLSPILTVQSSHLRRRRVNFSIFTVPLLRSSPIFLLWRQSLQTAISPTRSPTTMNLGKPQIHYILSVRLDICIRNLNKNLARTTMPNFIGLSMAINCLTSIA
jgi:hypothetical protein